MNIALVGYGKMGKAIEEIAVQRDHTIVLKIDVDNAADLTKENLSKADVAIEFTGPHSAFENVKKLLGVGTPVVCGSTGWTEHLDEIKKFCREKDGAFIYASNFSIGVNIFFELNKKLAALMTGHPEYRIGLEEIHHTQKKDAPSGTAITLAEQLMSEIPSKKKWVNEESNNPEELSIVSKRIDPAAGTHSIKYSSAIDDIEIIHTAHTRMGFAAGAVLAAEFIKNKKGIFTMKDVLGFLAPPMKKAIVFISAIVFFSCIAAAQKELDSLKQVIRLESDISKKADVIFLLCERYRGVSPDSCLLYANKAIHLLQPVKDAGRISKAEWYVTSYYYLTGHSDSALALAQKNIDWLKTQPSLQSLLAQFYSSSGLCLMKLDRKKEAFDRFYIALQTAEKCNDLVTQLKASFNIGWVKMELNQYEEAIASFTRAIRFIKEKNLPENNTGVIYNNLASCYGALNKIDSAYKYVKIAIEKSHLYHDIAGEANGWFILGTTQEKMGSLEDALQSFLKARPLREQMGDPFFIVSDLAELSSLYAKLGRTKEGISTALNALEIAKTNDISAKLPMIYTALALNYEAEKDFEKAAGVYKRINAFQDSMYADANPKALAEMQTKYETEKKERIIDQQQNKIARQNFIFLGIAGLVLMLCLLAYSQYKKYKLKKDAQLQAAIMKQQELASKAVIEAEEIERQRIARDLHDGVGQMMSAAKMNLSAFESEIKFSSEEQKFSFERIIDLVDDSCKEVRHVSHNMMPNVLLKNNLAAALGDFIDKMDKKTLEIHLYTEGLDERLDSNTETVLYRVIQECVNNVIKHAGATTLDISVTRDKNDISATIEDNGKGFDTSDKTKFDGIGLKNILTRVGFLKGSVEFDSAPGRGTAVSLHVPVINS